MRERERERDWREKEHWILEAEAKGQKCSHEKSLAVLVVTLFSHRGGGKRLTSSNSLLIGLMFWYFIT